MTQMVDCLFPNKKGITSYWYGCRCIRCKQENAIVSKFHYNKNKEKIKQRSRLRHKTLYKLFPEKKKDQSLRHKYKITLNEYNSLLQKQNYCCKICQLSKSENFKALAVDHNHITNTIRGLLCDNCNKGLGCFKDNIATLKTAILYLEQSEIKNA